MIRLWPKTCNSITLTISKRWNMSWCHGGPHIRLASPTVCVLELVSCHCTWLCWMFTLRSYATGPHFLPWCCYGSPRSQQPYVGTQVGAGHFQLVLESGKGCRQGEYNNNIMDIHEPCNHELMPCFLILTLPNPEAFGALHGVWSIKPLVCWEMWWFSPPHSFSKHRGVRWNMSASLISVRPTDGLIWLATRPLNFWSSILSMQSWYQMPLVFIPCYCGSLPFCCFLGVWVLEFVVIFGKAPKFCFFQILLVHMSDMCAICCAPHAKGCGLRCSL